MCYPERYNSTDLKDVILLQKEDGLLFMDSHTPLRTEVSGIMTSKLFRIMSFNLLQVTQAHLLSVI